MKKVIAMILCLLLVFPSVSGFAFAAEASCGGKCENSPTVVIPGLFQSEVFCYDKDGKIMLDSKGKERTGPFFMDTSEIVKDALNNALLPLSKTLLRREDEKHEFANALGDVLGKALMERIKSDENGNFVYDIRATKYNTAFSNLCEHDKEHILKAVPLESYIEKAGEDHLYFFSYSSLDNIERLAKQIYELIETAKKETGHSKVNIVPISQGGSLWNAVMEYYPQVAKSVDRVVYIVPAIDGSALIGDIFEKGLIDDDDALYGYMLPKLIGENDWLGYLANLLLRIVPKDVLNDVLDIAVDKLIKDYLSNSTCMWGLVPSGSYPAAREKYLSGNEKAVIRKQTDRYYNAQLNAKKNILSFREQSVEVFDIVGYNYSLYPIVDSWKEVNADGIIQLDSTSLGATSAPVDCTLGAGYTQKGNDYGTCSDPNHNHLDCGKTVDASTALLPDHTFYFNHHNHECTGSCDVILKLAIRLLCDKSFKNVYSYPDVFPQFNNSRISKSLINAVDEVRDFDESSLSPEDAKELKAAIAEVDRVLSETVVDEDAFKAAESRFYAAKDKAFGSPVSGSEVKKENALQLFKNVLIKFLKLLNTLMNKIMSFKETR